MSLLTAVQRPGADCGNSMEEGQGCHCSRCGQTIWDGTVAIRAWPESGEWEYRYHPTCFGAVPIYENADEAADDWDGDELLTLDLDTMEDSYMPLQLHGEYRRPRIAVRGKRARHTRGEGDSLWCAALFLTCVLVVSSVAGYIVGMWLRRCP